MRRTLFENRSLFRFALSGLLLLMTLIAGEAADTVPTKASDATASARATASAEKSPSKEAQTSEKEKSPGIPDVYVATNNSFVVSVPNLTRVAVGNPRAIIANVVSPTEVLVQGRPEVAREGDGIINIGQSHLYVWSGKKRYVYRVVVIENNDEKAFPDGVTRMDVEPDKVVLYGVMKNAQYVELQLETLRAAGIKIENRMELIDVAKQLNRLDRATAQEAISRHIVLRGMTREDVIAALGEPLEEPILDMMEQKNGRMAKVERLFYRDLSVTLVDDIVAEINQRSIDAETIEDAIKKGQVLREMTRDEMIQAKGEPAVPPEVRIEKDESGQTHKIEEYHYRDGVITLTNGRVTDISTYVSPKTNREIENVTLEGTSSSGDTIQTKVYRLRYAEAQEVIPLVRHFLTEQGTIVTQEYLRLVVVKDIPSAVATIDQLMRLIDAPRYDNGISIMRTKYIDGTGKDRTSGDVVMSKEIVLVHLGTFVDDQTRKKIVDGLQTLADRLLVKYVWPWSPPDRPPWFFVVDNVNANTVVMIGPPGILDVLTSYLSQNFVGLSNDDIERTIQNGGLVTGMTLAQVEAALGTKALRPPRSINSSSGLLWEYEYPNVLLRFRNDQLYQILTLPKEKDLEAAKRNRMVIWGLTLKQLEDVLGEKGELIPVPEAGREYEEKEARYKFPSGEAYFIRDRLEGFVPSAEASVIVSGDVMPSALGNMYVRLPREEQQRLLKEGIVVPGMTMSDVTRIYKGTPPSFTTVEFNKAGTAIWTYRYPGQTIKMIRGVVVEVNDEGQDELVTKIVKVVSRNVSEILPLVQQVFYSSLGADISFTTEESTDTTSANLSLDAASNSLIVRDRLKKITEIIKFVHDLDRETTKQVLIEAKFVEIDRSLLNQLGVQWAFSSQSNAGNKPFAGFGTTNSRTVSGQPEPEIQTGRNQTFNVSGNAGLLLGMLGGSGFSFGGLRYTNVDMLISALESNGDVTVLSSPRVMTLNNKSARLQNIKRVYDVYTNRFVDSLGQVTFSTETTEKEVGITLDVTPTIGEDGMITLDLEAVVSKVLETLTFGSAAAGNEAIINVIGEQNSQTRVMVRSGLPLVIGGLQTKEKHVNEDKIPILGSLPIIGHLFRSKKETDETVELLIFLTARVVPADGTLSAMETEVAPPRRSIPNPSPYTKPLTPSGSSNADAS